MSIKDVEILRLRLPEMPLPAGIETTDVDELLALCPIVEFMLTVMRSSGASLRRRISVVFVHAQHFHLTVVASVR